MLGDTAVAIHPEDERYLHLHGKKLRLPLMNREIPIILDDWVSRDFGTGAVKVTPAHDPNDFAIGERHHLPSINVMDDTRPHQRERRAVRRPRPLRCAQAHRRRSRSAGAAGRQSRTTPTTSATATAAKLSSSRGSPRNGSSVNKEPIRRRIMAEQGHRRRQAVSARRRKRPSASRRRITRRPISTG